MSRGRSAGVGAAVVGALGLAIAVGPRRTPREPPAPRALAATDRAPGPSAPPAPPPPAEMSPTEPRGDDDAGRGEPLPLDAPESVRFGVILVTYAGAEGAPPGARSREDARGLARELAQAARGGLRAFRAATRRGDRGSTANAGRIGRGVLEPHVERALFLLAPGEVGEPIDTPRGFWIPRRIE